MVFDHVLCSEDIDYLFFVRFLSYVLNLAFIQYVVRDNKSDNIDTIEQVFFCWIVKYNDCLHCRHYFNVIAGEENFY